MSLKKDEILKFLRHVLKAHDAKNADKYVTPAEIASYNSGSSVAVDVFTGASASAAGTSGLVPPPAIGDNDKFLCGDGTWALPGGASYSEATTLQAGLMSATDKQRLDSLFYDTADLTDAVISVVGGNFVPSVDNISDFCTFKDGNIQYFDNRLKHIIEGDSGLGVARFTRRSDPVTLQNGNAVVSTGYDDSGSYTKYYLISEGHNSINIGIENATLGAGYSYLTKLSESVCFLKQEVYNWDKNVTWYYEGIETIKYFRVAQNGNLTSVGAASICPAASSVQSAYGSNEMTWFPSLYDPNHLVFMTAVYNSNASGQTSTYGYTTIAFNTATAAATRVKAYTSIGVQYNYDIASKTIILDAPNNSYRKPKFTFSDSDVTIGSQGNANALPFFKYETGVTNASKVVTGGGKYVLIHHGCYGAAPSTLQLTTLSGGVTSTLNSWLEDDDNVVAGIWHSRSSEKIYAVTFKRGTYSTVSAKWFDNAATVWLFDFLTPRCIKTTLKLSDIINDLII